MTEPIPDSEFVEPPLMPSDPISERMIDVADDAFRSGSSDEQAWRECLGDALYAVYPLIREQVMAEASQGKRAVSALLPVNEPETALAFYADKSNYTAQNPVGSGAHVWRDMGGRARTALAAADRDKPDEECVPGRWCIDCQRFHVAPPVSDDPKEKP